MSYTHPPALFSVVRITTLLTALLVSLGSGTNYVRLLLPRLLRSARSESHALSGFLRYVMH